MALVSTSSICQGEQVALLWPTILDTATINFAYRPFKWANSAANNAGVWCTIVGLGRSEEHTSELQPLMRISYAVFCLKKKKQLTYQLPRLHQTLLQQSPYLQYN